MPLLVVAPNMTFLYATTSEQQLTQLTVTEPPASVANDKKSEDWHRWTEQTGDILDLYPKNNDAWLITIQRFPNGYLVWNDGAGRLSDTLLPLAKVCSVITDAKLDDIEIITTVSKAHAPGCKTTVVWHHPDFVQPAAPIDANL